MSGMLQNGVVVLLVSIAFAYSAWVLMPAAWRASLMRRLGGPAAAAAETGGCGGCGGCSSAGAQPARPGTATAVVTVRRRAVPATGITPRRDESAGASAS